MSTQTDISARTVFGVYPDGTYCIIHTQGQSTVYGLNYTQLQNLCISEGLYHAVALDGGGSSQLLWNNVYLQPSADGTPRKLAAGYICIKTPLRTFDTGWLNMPISSAVSSGSIQCRQIDDKVSYKYNFDLVTAISDTTYTVVTQSGLSRYLYPYLGHPGNTYSTWISPRSQGQVGTMSVFSAGSSTAAITVQTGTSTSTTFRGGGSFISAFSAAEFN